MGIFAIARPIRIVLDGGFGGQTATNANLSTGLQGPNLDPFGDGTSNVPPLIEAADTGPFFHSHASGMDIDPIKYRARRDDVQKGLL